VAVGRGVEAADVGGDGGDGGGVFVDEAVVQVAGGVVGVEGLFCGEVGEPVGDGVAGGVEAVEGGG
jgi:hypothetical protein